MQVTLCAAVSLDGGGNNAAEKRTLWTVVAGGMLGYTAGGGGNFTDVKIKTLLRVSIWQIKGGS